MEKHIKAALMSVCAAVMMITTFAVPQASASWRDEVTSGEKVEIVGQDCVVDTFCGIEALYNEGNRDHQCVDLVKDFYSELFGVDFVTNYGTGIYSQTDGYEFVVTDDPQPGDILFIPTEMSGNSCDHFAVVKEYKDGYISIFEQNVLSGGCALIGRKVLYPSNCYAVYTMMGKASLVYGAEYSEGFDGDPDTMVRVGLKNALPEYCVGPNISEIEISEIKIEPGVLAASESFDTAAEEESTAVPQAAVSASVSNLEVREPSAALFAAVAALMLLVAVSPVLAGIFRKISRER